MSFNPTLESNDVRVQSTVRPRRRRDNLPQHARDYLKAWVRDHIMHPYPTEEEKALFAHELNLTLNQVNNWFINARRRDVIKIRREMGLEVPSIISSRRAIRRPHHRHINIDSENALESHNNVHSGSTQPGTSLLGRGNSHSSPAKTTDGVNNISVDPNYNLNLLYFAAMIHSNQYSSQTSLV